MKKIIFKVAFVATIAMVGMLFSCSENQSDIEKFTWNDFENKFELKGRTVDFEDAILKPFSIQVYDSVLITLEPSRDVFCQLFDLNKEKKMGERLKMGEGPNEMMMPMFVSNGKELGLIDLASSSLYNYDFKEFITNQSPTPINKIKLAENVDSEMQVLNDHYVGYQYFKDELLYLFDKSGNKIKPLARFPEKYASLPQEERSDILQMGFVSNGQDKIAITYYQTDLIDIYDAEGNLIKRMQGPEQFDYTKTGKDAFFSSKNAGESFWVLYNGEERTKEGHKSSCSKLLSFSWDGVPESVYTLDDPIFTFCVDVKRNRIYGVSTTPEYHIVEYILPDL